MALYALPLAVLASLQTLIDLTRMNRGLHARIELEGQASAVVLESRQY
jgi:hypothetical protein